MRVDYLIVGQGLAGTTLALELSAAGKEVLVVDDPATRESAASRVAAGIVNPVTGKRLARSWKVEVLLPAAREFYRAWERRYGRRVFHTLPLLRFLTPEQERRYWPRRVSSGELDDYVREVDTGAVDRKSGIRTDGKAVEFAPAGYLDTRTFLDTSAAGLGAAGCLRRERFVFDELRADPGRVTWRDVRATKIIFCEGWRAAANPFFDWLPYTPSKGEILTLRVPGMPGGRILNRGKWVLPTGGERVRVGATYGWTGLGGPPTAEGGKELLDAFSSLVTLPGQLIDHRAGVRPAVKDTKPVIGLHPGNETVGIFNGFGSKGVMMAPHFARRFVAYLEQGVPLDDEVDVRRNL